MIVGILILLLLFLSFAYMKKEMFLKIVILGTFLRLSLIVVYFAGINLPESSGDAKNFFLEGRAVFDYLFFDGDKVKVINPYSNVVGTTMVYSGDNLILALILNTICYIIIAYALYEIIKILSDGDKKSAVRGVWILSLFPMDILYSAVLLREQTIIMFLALSFLFLLKYIKQGKIVDFLVSVLFHVGSVLFHSGILFLLVVHLYVLIFYRKKSKIIKFKALKISFLGIFGLVLFKILGNTYKFAFLKDIFNIEFLNHVVVGRFLASTGTGRTMYLMNLVPSSTLEFIIYLPIRIFYFLFSPFVWMIGGVADIFVMVDGGIYLILVILAWKKLKLLENKLKKAIIFYFLAFTVVFSIGTTNYGTAMRHRHKILWLICAVSVIPKKRFGQNLELVV